MNEEEMVRKSLKELANSIFSKLDDVEKTYLVMVNNEKNKQINDLQQELQRKDNIINELKKWLNEPHITYNLDATEFGIEKIECVSVKDILDKIQELENDIK